MAKRRASKRPPARKRQVNGSAAAPVPPLNAGDEKDNDHGEQSGEEARA